MKILFSLTLLIAVTLAHATEADLPTCAADLDDTVGALPELIEDLRRREHTELLNVYDSDRVARVALPSSTSTLPFVRVRRSMWGKPSLEYARLAFAGSAERERAERELVRGLFTLELEARFRDRPPGAGRREVARYQAKRITKLLVDYYEVMGELQFVSAATILPPKDPGRTWLPPIAALIKGPPRKLAPNWHDLEKYFLPGGEETLATVIEDNYGRALMYAHLRRQALRSTGKYASMAAVAGGVGYGVIMSPLARHAPAPQPEISASQRVGAPEAPRDQSPARPDSELTEGERSAARTKLRQLRERLDKAKHQSTSRPPTAQIDELQREILDLTNRYPFLLLPGEPAAN